MEFEWDTRKAEQNIAKHGVPFDLAVQVFLDPQHLDTEDERHDYKEERRVILGRIQGRLFVVTYTWRGDLIRLISARKANEREQRRYHQTL